jgi:Uncharacterized conserved protein
MERTRVNQKVLVLGIDGMDPRFSTRMLKKNRMPNLQKIIDSGSAREDLVMLGGHPTGTPPMWTTLTTGAYSNTHGITDFNLDSEKGLDYFGYAFDSRKCLAETLWNVTAEAGLKTLVFHWPGSSWPPTSDSENLHVIDGTQPCGVNMGTGLIEPEFFIIASAGQEQVIYKGRGSNEGVAPCAITDLEVTESLKDSTGLPTLENPDVKKVCVTPDQGTDGFVKNSDTIQVLSPIKEANGWAKDIPEGSKEFTMLFSGGMTRRPALILKNENGVYDRIEFYKNKNAQEPIAVLPYNVYVYNIVDDTIKANQTYHTNKSFRVLDLAEDGSYVKIYVSDAMNIDDEGFFSPASLHDQVVEAAGYIPTAPMTYALSKRVATDCLGTQWDYVCQWQSKAMHALIEQNRYDVVFSHCHNVDAQAHMVIRHMKTRSFSLITPDEALDCLERVYEQTDKYLGTFTHFIDEGWTIFIISDHALVCPEYERPAIADCNGVNVQLMRELGFTEVLKDENGNDIPEIDWAHTKAIASRSNNIYINLKGKYDHGIVEPEDQYELEEEIITALYSYKHPVSGKRVINLAFRNKDAVMLGMGGPHCGDILYWTADGYNDDHFDGVATCWGLNDTSLSPIFIAAGPGIKKNFKTARVIREVDFVPTMAIICGVRMPENCEGAPVYQILENEF